MIELYVIGGILAYIGGGVAVARWQHHAFIKKRIYKPVDAIEREAKAFGLTSFLWYCALLWPALAIMWPIYAFAAYGVLPAIAKVQNFITAPGRKLIEEKKKTKPPKGSNA